MLDNIYTTQRCPVCKGKMVHDERKGGCFCSNHPDVASSGGFYVKFGRAHFKRFESYLEASRHLNGLRFQKDHGQYDPRDWQRDHPLGFVTQASKWLEFNKKQGLKDSTIENLGREINRATRHFG